MGATAPARSLVLMRRAALIAAIITGALAVMAGCGGDAGPSGTAEATDACARSVGAFISARDSGRATVDAAAESLAVCPGRDEWSAAYRAAGPGDGGASDEAVVAALMSACDEADPDRLTTTCAGLGPG